MANNAPKVAICNRARLILNAGLTSQAGVLFDAIDDTEFADYTKVSEAKYPDKRLICFIYEPILRQVILDMRPDFARRYADLGRPRKIDQAFGRWDYLFELPGDFLGLLNQCAEGDHDREENLSQGYRCEVLHCAAYSHVVCGSDDLAYYCSTSHTSADDSDDGQPPTDDGDGNWTLYDEDGSLGAEWAAAVSYKYKATGSLLATNHLTNAAGDAAYIKYLAYVRAGRSDQPQYYPEAFANALATRLAAELAQDSKDYERRRLLLEEYERLAKPAAWTAENAHKARVRPLTVFEKRTRF